MSDSRLRTAGMILAAGRGTRMEPLSSSVPKALLPVLGKPLFGIIAEKLLREGASHLHANLFHLGGPIEEYSVRCGYPVTFHPERELLDTGGGIGNMAASLRDFDMALIHNCDVISSIGFAPAIEMHRRAGALFTMILARGPGGAPALHLPPPHVEVSEDGSIAGFAGRGGPSRAGSARGGFAGGDLRPGSLPPDVNGNGSSRRVAAPGAVMYGYTGMAVMSLEAAPFFPVGRKAGLVDILLAMIDKKPGSVKGYLVDGDAHPFSWGETGSPGAYIDLHRRILSGGELFDPALRPPPLPLYAGEGSVIDPLAGWKGFLCAGSGSSIGGNTLLEDCVVFDGVKVAPGVSGRSSVFYQGGDISAYNEK